MYLECTASYGHSEHIVSIHGYFEENGTAYFAMEYLEGRNLKQYMEEYGGPLPVHEANRILLPVMEALDWVHSKGIVHRDISPDNIVIKKDGAAKLIDFGAARQSTGEKSKSLDVVLKHGFAPMEQYSRRGRQGPFTDVYAMAATYYYAITGKVPPDAVDRMSEDELIPPGALGVKIRKNTEQVLLKALAVNAPERYQRMSEVYSALLETMPLPFSSGAGEENRAKEKQEMAYREACRLMETSKTEAEYKAVIRQFEKLQGYKDSRDRITQCGTAVTAMKEEQRRQKEEEAKRRAEEKEKKRLTKTETQKKADNESDRPRKKKPVAIIAAVLAVAILLGIVFGSGVLKKSPAVSEPVSTAAPTEEAETTPVPEETAVPEETPEQESEEEETLPPGDFKTVGSIVTFGSYEQDNDLTNGKEPIEWIVLDVQDGKSLLISKYALDSQKYNTDPTLVTWETCSLRSWLNDSFLNEAFSGDEQLLIPEVTVESHRNPDVSNVNPGKPTIDRVFLLSIQEAEQYFSSNEERRCAPTAYAKTGLTYVNRNLGTCLWWLRSPGSNWNSAAFAAGIFDDGSLNTEGTYVNNNNNAVRPALWIDWRKLELTTIGGTVTFGAYEQDNDLTNGKEPIEWIVLDVQDGQSLLISRQILDHQVYNQQYVDVTWQKSTLRVWLNGSFLSTAFSAQEQAGIIKTQVDNGPEQGNCRWETDGGDNTTDRVFLLSCAEAERYFVLSAMDGRAACHPTAYAVAQGIPAEYDKYADNAAWWLRSPGEAQTGTAIIDRGGFLNSTQVINIRPGVRPAIWVKIAS